MQMLKFCMPAFREAAVRVEMGEDLNVTFFDIYMAEEYYVRRHEPAAVNRWQRNTPGINLHTVDIFRLDWTLNRVSCGMDWEGEQNCWNTSVISPKGWENIADSAARIFKEWYDHPYAMYEGEQRIYCGDVLAELHTSPDRANSNLGSDGDVGGDGDGNGSTDVGDVEDLLNDQRAMGNGNGNGDDDVSGEDE
ncbi:hypothetical protein L210DRAFT_3507532 [Boletus edulis BED1]|uniref:Uncharacterized protein n=1 Tax=Boletus edulis BED1 TaxID=1328754 RepID=A0AAD4GAL1_BOLED|nr:hypothetical protein L210DRAFT_3507532 [Boletus edulis BED1]